MDTYEQDLAAWETELREKYNQKERDEAAAKGHAMEGGGYPIKDQDDLEKAIHAVGRGNASHDAIRAHIITNAKRLGLLKLIPENWNTDGSLSEEKDTDLDTEDRDVSDGDGPKPGMKVCPTCKGKGTILQGNKTCPECKGSGEVPATEQKSAKRRKERRRAVPLMPEVRHWKATGIEVRSANETNEISITGEPIAYNTDYTVMDMFGEFTERMAPGVASEVLANGADVRFLFNHDGLPLARSTSGTLSLTDGLDGLTFEARLDARQQLANDLAIAIERGDVSQMSCGFIVARDEWDDAMEDRTIHQLADLLDVSAVTYPASPTTSIQIAQRMAMEMPVESRARLLNVERVLRSGKVLSADSQQKVLDGLAALHGLAKVGGVDTSGFFEDKELQTDNSDADIGEGQAYLDGTGERSDAVVDPGEKIRSNKASALRLQVEARVRRRKIAA